jgi:ubiquinone/menaquinone biosynthesis C-methylase UbiE
MHAFARHLHPRSGQEPVQETKGLILDGGWRYDLGIWFIDSTMFRGQLHHMRQRAVELARVESGARVLDVGCGTGTLALEAARLVGHAGHVVGIDPSARQIARARTKAARGHLAIEFQTGVIEQLPFPDQTFDVVFATLMMHHLPASLKRQGLAEVARVLKPGGCLVIGDFFPKAERHGQAARFHAGGSSMRDLVALVSDAGFSGIETEEMPPARFSAFPGAGFVRGHKSEL